jgi:hypothetical protein
MADLWFTRDLGRLERHGALLYTVAPGGVWAVLRLERTFPGDLAQESAELLGTYGALAHGVGHLLAGDGVVLPPEFLHWATAPNVPADQLGAWEPALIEVDGAAQTALARRFGGLTLFAATWEDEHLALLLPTAEARPEIVLVDDLEAPAPGGEAHGG